MDRDYKDKERDEHVVDLLSAYIDNALTHGERDSVRAHLDTCTTCKVEHDGLIGTQAMLRNLPIVPPPRAFTLTAEMVGAGKLQESFWQRLFTPRVAPRFAMGSVMAFALMFFLLVGNSAMRTNVGDFAAYSPSIETSRQAPPPEQSIDTEALKAAPTTGAAEDATTFGAQATVETGMTGGASSVAEQPTAVSQAPPQEEVQTGISDNGEGREGGTSDTFLLPPNPESAQPVAAPVLELALAAAGTVLAIAALVARRRGA